jgi:ribosomal protein L37AE/L43A
LKTNKDIRAGQLRRGYGLSLEQYDSMLEACGGVCEICRLPPSGHYNFLVVDHDRRTGKIRGLLCSLCNRSIGCFKESSEVLRRAAVYIERANASTAIQPRGAISVDSRGRASYSGDLPDWALRLALGSVFDANARVNAEYINNTPKPLHICSECRRLCNVVSADANRWRCHSCVSRELVRNMSPEAKRQLGAGLGQTSEGAKKAWATKRLKAATGAGSNYNRVGRPRKRLAVNA